MAPRRTGPLPAIFARQPQAARASREDRPVDSDRHSTSGAVLLPAEEFLRGTDRQAEVPLRRYAPVELQPRPNSRGHRTDSQAARASAGRIIAIREGA